MVRKVVEAGGCEGKEAVGDCSDGSRLQEEERVHTIESGELDCATRCTRAPAEGGRRAGRKARTLDLC